MKDKKIIHPEYLLNAYASGIFPMAENKESTEVAWFEPQMRGIFPMESFKVSKNVLRAIRNKPFSFTINKAFRLVMEGCAQRESTWISEVIMDSYTYLHQLGFAHSVEVWLKNSEGHNTLAGGLYGVSLGGCILWRKYVPYRTRRRQNCTLLLPQAIGTTRVCFMGYAILYAPFRHDGMYRNTAARIPQFATKGVDGGSNF